MIEVSILMAVVQMFMTLCAIGGAVKEDVVFFCSLIIPSIIFVLLIVEVSIREKENKDKKNRRK